jgi:hypothetical protein
MVTTSMKIIKSTPEIYGIYWEIFDTENVDFRQKFKSNKVVFNPLHQNIGIKSEHEFLSSIYPEGHIIFEYFGKSYFHVV